MLTSFNEWKGKSKVSNNVNMDSVDKYFRKWEFEDTFFDKGQNILQGAELPLKERDLKSKIENPGKMDISYATTKTEGY